MSNSREAERLPLMLSQQKISMNKIIGTSLIEIMISLLLLAIFMLGLDAMQITAFNQTRHAYFYSVAIQQLNQMAERIMACQENNCDQQVEIWNQQNAEVLPQGKGKISGYYPHYVIAIFWGAYHSESCEQNKIGQEGCLQLNVYA